MEVYTTVLKGFRNSLVNKIIADRPEVFLIYWEDHNADPYDGGETGGLEGVYLTGQEAMRAARAFRRRERRVKKSERLTYSIIRISSTELEQRVQWLRV